MFDSISKVRLQHIKKHINKQAVWLMWSFLKQTDGQPPAGSLAKARFFCLAHYGRDVAYFEHGFSNACRTPIAITLSCTLLLSNARQTPISATLADARSHAREGPATHAKLRFQQRSLTLALMHPRAQQHTPNSDASNDRWRSRSCTSIHMSSHHIWHSKNHVFWA